MPHWSLDWSHAALIAFGIALGSILCARLAGRALSFGRRLSSAAAALREAALVVGLYALWQLAGLLSVTQLTGALGRGVAIYRAERALHLPNEVTLQRVVLPHRWLDHLLDAYYIYGHFVPVTAFLCWLWWRHRDAYPFVRTTLAVATGVALVVQLLPVAPPRLLPQLGFADTARLLGESVYGAYGSWSADQLSAMPSVHVEWAVLIAVTVWRVGRGRWRWLAVAHGVLMPLVVVATANHWELDAVVAAVLVGLSAMVVRVVQQVPFALSRWAVAGFTGTAAGVAAEGPGAVAVEAGSAAAR